MAYKRILTIQDISCLGQCSMTVALPVLSACGHETCILPTALLSTHTGGFHSPSITQLAGSMAGIREHWQRERITFDCIYTGYLGSIAAIRETERIMETLLAPDGIVIVDPAMADHGRLYSGFDKTYQEAMLQLCQKADILLPNITEAAMLSGLPYEKNLTEAYVAELMDHIPGKRVVMTGAGYGNNEIGVAVKEFETRYEYHHKKFAGSYHGTGDLFAACFTGALLRGKPMKQASRIAADTVCYAIACTEKHPAHWYGVKFEEALGRMMARLSD